MAEGGGAEFRRAGRPDRRHASHHRRREAVDIGSPVPARAQPLHVAAGSRSSTARHLYRLVDASHAWRRDGGRAAGGRKLRLAPARRNVRRARHGGNHARTADHGAAIPRLHGCLPGSGRALTHAGWYVGRSRRASCGSSSALHSSRLCAATRRSQAPFRR